MRLLPAALLCAAAAAALVPGPEAGARRPSPTITAQPTNVMVNGTVTLHGTGFPRRSTFELEECSRTSWFVPQQPCAQGNAVTVTTGRHGRFTTTMRAEVCPEVMSGPTRTRPSGSGSSGTGPSGSGSSGTGPTVTGPTERTCYIGQPVVTGVDTLELRGAARIVVSWP